MVWATQRARHFVLGTKFILSCDHQPLEFILRRRRIFKQLSFFFIFSPSKELPKATSARIMRWAMQLVAFDLEIAYVCGSTIPHVDARSRYKFENDKQDQPDRAMDSFVHWTETNALKLRFNKLHFRTLCYVASSGGSTTMSGVAVKWRRGLTRASGSG